MKNKVYCIFLHLVFIIFFYTMGLLNIDSDWLMNILRCAVTTQMLGRILNLNKKKLKDFQNHMSQYFIHNRKQRT